MKKDYWLYLAALAGGIAVWAVVSDVSGKREAWDSEWYFLIGMPAVCLLSAILGFIEPKNSWRWGVVPLAGQLAWMVLTQGVGNLLPLGVIVFGILAIPSVATALLGAFIRNRMAKRDGP